MLNVEIQDFGLGNLLFGFARNFTLSHICIKVICVWGGIFFFPPLKIQACSCGRVKVWWAASLSRSSGLPLRGGFCCSSLPAPDGLRALVLFSFLAAK